MMNDFVTKGIETEKKILVKILTSKEIALSWAVEAPTNKSFTLWNIGPYISSFFNFVPSFSRIMREIFLVQEWLWGYVRQKQ